MAQAVQWCASKPILSASILFIAFSVASCERKSGIGESCCGAENCRPELGCFDGACRPIEAPPAPEGAGAEDVANCDGDPRVCFGLAKALVEGAGIPRDRRRAAAIYDRGCEARDGMSCNNLSTLLIAGQGVARDPARATAALQKACTYEIATACDRLGDLYARGADAIGSADASKAAEYYRLGLAKGYPRSGAKLGRLHLQGRGVERDSAKGAALMQEACDRGSALSCDDLGDAYGQGVGLTVDTIMALGYYDRACKGGFNLGCKHAAKLREE